MRPLRPFLFVLAVTAALGCEPCERARVRLAEGEPAEAEAIHQEAIKPEKDDPAPHGWMIVARATRLKGREAADALKGFLKRDPSPELRTAIRAALPDLQTTRGVDVLPQCDEGVTPPVLLESAAPKYPSAGKIAGLEKGILVLATVGAKGTVVEWDWDRSGDWGQAHYAGFGSAAMEGVSKWRFFPALRDGVPVACRFQADMTFRLIKGF